MNELTLPMLNLQSLPHHTPEMGLPILQTNNQSCCYIFWLPYENNTIVCFDLFSSQVANQILKKLDCYYAVSQNIASENHIFLYQAISTLNIFHKNREIFILMMKKKPTARLTLLQEATEDPN
jgi:hypothetical protein